MPLGPKQRWRSACLAPTLREMDAVQARFAFWTLAVELGLDTFVVRRIIGRLARGEIAEADALRALVHRVCDAPRAGGSDGS